MSVGSELRRSREAAGLTLADIARETKIRASLLEHLEADDFDAAGGAVYARGHVRSVAAVIGIDAAPLIKEFDATHESVPVPVMADAFPARGAVIRERHRPNWLAYGVGAAAVLTVLLAVTALEGGGSAAKQPGIDAKGGTPAVASTASAAPTTPAATPSASPKPTQILALLEPVTVQIKILKAPGSWVQESDDGAHSFAQVLAPGTTKTFAAQKQVKLVLGNAGAVDLTVNGKHLGSPGSDGEVVTSTFTPTSTTGQG